MARMGQGDCRRFAAAYLKTMDAELAAQAIGAADGTALLGSEVVAAQVEAQRAILKRQIMPEDVVRQLAALAFGRSNDCVKLALEAAPEIDALDLRLLSEIKRNEKGTVEIRLIDRLAALERLSALVSATDETASAFLAAMTAACETP